MPHSPYEKTFDPPLSDIHDWKKSLDRHRVEMENDERNKWRDDELLEIGDDLFEQCDFLENKLAIKKDEHSRLVEQIDTLKKGSQDLKAENEVLKEEINAQKMEIAALKSDLKKLGTAPTTEGQLDSRGDSRSVKISQDVNSEVKEAEKPEESEDPPVTAALANPLKRGASNDAAIDEQAAKKEKTG